MDTAAVANTTFVTGFLSVQMSRVGATIGTLEIRMGDGSGTFPTLLGTYTGTSASGNEWDLVNIALPTPMPANVQFQFHYSRGSSFTGDIALDDVCYQ